MSALDKAITELEGKRAQAEAERKSRQNAGFAFLSEFFDSDLATSRKLKDRGIAAAFDGKKIVLHRPEEGVYAEGMAIVVGEQGEIDVSGRSLGTAEPANKEAKKLELIAEIISHFSL